MRKSLGWIAAPIGMIVTAAIILLVWEGASPQHQVGVMIGGGIALMIALIIYRNQTRKT